MTTEVPSAVASLAASSLLIIPPVPPLDEPLPRRRASPSTVASRGMRVALASTLGLAVKSPSTLVSSTSKSASSATATRAASPSLSPKTRMGASPPWRR